MKNQQFAEESQPIRHYFIDEGGDSTIFSRRGKVLVGTEGCSRFFILGLLEVSEPTALQRRLEELRTELVNDAYFKRRAITATERSENRFGFSREG